MKSDQLNNQQQLQQQYQQNQIQQQPSEIQRIVLKNPTYKDIEIDSSLKWITLNTKKTNSIKEFLEEEAKALDEFIEKLNQDKKRVKEQIKQLYNKKPGRKPKNPLYLQIQQQQYLRSLSNFCGVSDNCNTNNLELRKSASTGMCPTNKVDDSLVKLNKSEQISFEFKQNSPNLQQPQLQPLISSQQEEDQKDKIHRPRGRPKKRRNPFQILEIQVCKDGEVIEEIYEPKQLTKLNFNTNSSIKLPIESIYQQQVLFTNQLAQSQAKVQVPLFDKEKFNQKSLTEQTTVLLKIQNQLIKNKHLIQEKQCKCCNQLVKRHFCQHILCSKPCKDQIMQNKIRSSYNEKKQERKEQIEKLKTMKYNLFPEEKRCGFTVCNNANSNQQSFHVETNNFAKNKEEQKTDQQSQQSLNNVNNISQIKNNNGSIVESSSIASKNPNKQVSLSQANSDFQEQEEPENCSQE